MSVASINGVTSTNISKIDGVNASGIASVMGQTLSPPIPAFTNVAAAWGLNGWGGTGITAGNGVNLDTDGDITFDAAAPYALHWSGITSGNQPTATWYDQNGNANNLTAAGATRPTLDVTNKLISFDGVANGMRSATQLYSGGQIGTIYIPFKAGSLVETSVVFETGTGAADQVGRISIRMVAGVFTFSVYDTTAVVCLPNTKIKTISDSNWHFATCTFDGTQGTPANQTGLKIDNSTSGVTSPTSADVAAATDIGKDLANVGARNNAASTFFTGKMRFGYVTTDVQTPTQQTAFFDYWTYLQSTLP